jgi:hypothetical protein
MSLSINRATLDAEWRAMANTVQGDADLVAEIARELRDRGIAVFVAKDLKPGSQWGREVTRAIQSCTHFVTVISEDALLSMHVRDEVRNAVERRERTGAPVIISICIQPIHIGDDHELSAQLGQHQAIAHTLGRHAGPLVDRLLDAEGMGAKPEVFFSFKFDRPDWLYARSASEARIGSTDQLRRHRARVARIQAVPEVFRGLGVEFVLCPPGVAPSGRRCERFFHLATRPLWSVGSAMSAISAQRQIDSSNAAAINRLPGFNLDLPTSEEWDYACELMGFEPSRWTMPAGGTKELVRLGDGYAVRVLHVDRSGRRHHSGYEVGDSTRRDSHMRIRPLARPDHNAEVIP